MPRTKEEIEQALAFRSPNWKPEALKHAQQMASISEADAEHAFDGHLESQAAPGYFGKHWLYPIVPEMPQRKEGYRIIFTNLNKKIFDYIAYDPRYLSPYRIPVYHESDKNYGTWSYDFTEKDFANALLGSPTLRRLHGKNRYIQKMNIHVKDGEIESFSPEFVYISDEVSSSSSAPPSSSRTLPPLPSRFG